MTAPHPATRWVATGADLRDLCTALGREAWIALDTEFMREDTYYPRLCLIQVAAPGTVACIDPLAITDLDPLLDLVYDPGVLKVLHASRQDLEIFHHLRGAPPAPIFDTQLAAPLVGLPAQASYATLVAEVLGEHLDKAHTRTDWCRRPLSTDQIDYAADDVRYLAPLYLALRERLDRAGMTDWLAEDFAALSEAAVYECPPRDAWLRIRGTDRLVGRERAILAEVAAWRERAARRADRPRGWLLRDEVAVELARAAPRDEKGLAAVRGIPAGTVRRHGADLLAAVAAGIDAPEVNASARSGRPPPMSAEEEAIFARLAGAARAAAERHGIDPTVLASRKDLMELLRGGESCRLLRGWRRRATGADLVQIMEAARTRPIGGTGS